MVHRAQDLCTWPGAAGFVVFVAALALGGRGAAWGLTSLQGPESLRAAFLFNFAKFTEWPPEALAPSSALVMCVIDDAQTAHALEQMNGQQVAPGHPVVVRRTLKDGTGRECHLLYMGRGLETAEPGLLPGVRDRPILIVSESPAVLDAGGTVLLYTENNRMRFAVNIDAAQRQRLRLSSRLLGLARIVRGRNAPAP